jgi:hypothetical protein
MAIQSFNTRSLKDIFGDVAQSQVDPYKQGRVVGRNKVIAGDAASGRLSSGVASNDLNAYDLATNQGESAIRAGVLPAEAQGTLQGQQNDFLSNQSELDYQRSYSLAKMLGEMNKPTTLQEIMAGVGAGSSLLGNAGTAYRAFK